MFLFFTVSRGQTSIHSPNNYFVQIAIQSKSKFVSPMSWHTASYPASLFRTIPNVIYFNSNLMLVEPVVCVPLNSRLVKYFFLLTKQVQNMWLKCAKKRLKPPFRFTLIQRLYERFCFLKWNLMNNEWSLISLQNVNLTVKNSLSLLFAVASSFIRQIMCAHSLLYFEVNIFVQSTWNAVNISPLLYWFSLVKRLF